MVELVPAWLESSDQCGLNISSIFVCSTHFFGPRVPVSGPIGDHDNGTNNQGYFKEIQICGQFQPEEVSHLS